MITPKEYIDSIKNDHLRSSEITLDSLTGAIDRLQKAFPRYGSFLMEFIQNSDDAKSEDLRIEIDNDSISILNNGNPFSEADVKSICKVGRSSKTAKDYIGYLGVGFKSIFLISEHPEIYSGDFRFSFAKDAWDDSEHIPWQIIPLWLDTTRVGISEEFKTVFNVPFKDVNFMNIVREEVGQDQLNNRILLFLRNIKNIEILNSSKSQKRKITKSKLQATSEYEIYQIQEYQNDDLKMSDNWLVLRVFQLVLSGI
jgi:hypothetical protein